MTGSDGFRCAKCGKPITGRSLMDTMTEASLCLACYAVRKKYREASASQEAGAADSAALTFPRIPTDVRITIPDAQGKPQEYVYEAVSVSLNLRGVCFEWTGCPQCWGYEANSVHPNCFFSPYFLRRTDAHSLDLMLHLEPGLSVPAKAKIVYTLFDDSGVEFVGAAFVRITPVAVDQLRGFVEKVKVHQ